jgi:hypothetical protein
VVTRPDIFKKVVERLIPFIKAKGNDPCFIILPIPRYLFGDVAVTEDTASTQVKKITVKNFVTFCRSLERTHENVGGEWFNKLQSHGLLLSNNLPPPQPLTYLTHWLSC